ncbi:hypothetical protein F4774DRAFT_429484 [Daldinia eschscholtzii]|nr:hypothetical protein F4774DRAFT_429484 [Daldinia eschscholtzii]
MVNDLMQQSFECPIIALPAGAHGQGNPSSVIAAVTLKKAPFILPRRGEECEIRIDNDSFEDFSASCDLIKNDGATGPDMIAEIYAALSKIYSGGEKTIRDADLDNLAKIPLEPHIESCGGDRRRCNFGLDLPKAGEQYSDYIETASSPLFCSFVVNPFTKALRQEIQAHGEFPAPYIVSHFTIFPQLASVAAGAAPRHLQRMFGDMDESKKANFKDHMKAISCSIAALSGTAACGKSRFGDFTLNGPLTQS